MGNKQLFSEFSVELQYKEGLICLKLANVINTDKEKLK